MHLDCEPAIKVLKKLLHEVADIKRRHGRAALRPQEASHDEEGANFWGFGRRGRATERGKVDADRSQRKGNVQKRQ
jgi:hypothetical protein